MTRSRRRTKTARAHWQRAYDGFRRSVTMLGGDDGLRAQYLGVMSRFNAADSAFHGLDDEKRGRKGFEEMLRYADRTDLPAEATQTMRFHAHVDLGRMLAHAGETGAWDHWLRARAVLPENVPAERFYRARIRLLRAVLLAAHAGGLALPEGGDLDALGLAAATSIRGRFSRPSRSARSRARSGTSSAATPRASWSGSALPTTSRTAPRGRGTHALGRVWLALACRRHRRATSSTEP